MLKRLMLIAVMVFSMMGLLQAQALGSISWCTGGGCSSVGWNTYTLYFELKGGGSSDYLLGTVVGAELEILNAALICDNPQSYDVSGGLGGNISLFTVATEGNTTQVDETGKFTLDSAEIYAIRDEIPIPTPNALYPTQQEYFNWFWHVDSSFCKKSGQWNPYLYAILEVNITGHLWKDCTNPNGPYEEPNCVDGGMRSAFCETLEDPREFALDNSVEYTCVPLGDPIALKDDYSVRKGKTLIVSAPGVLGNDHDTGDAVSPILTASLFSNVSHGTLVLSSNGSFTYTPNAGYVGVDSFQYRVSDTVNYSNDAYVTITVK
jgi:hypothetical protein